MPAVLLTILQWAGARELRCTADRCMPEAAALADSEFVPCVLLCILCGRGQGDMMPQPSPYKIRRFC